MLLPFVHIRVHIRVLPQPVLLSDAAWLASQRGASQRGDAPPADATATAAPVAAPAAAPATAAAAVRKPSMAEKRAQLAARKAEKAAAAGKKAEPAAAAAPAAAAKTDAKEDKRAKLAAKKAAMQAKRDEAAADSADAAAVPADAEAAAAPQSKEDKKAALAAKKAAMAAKKAAKGKPSKMKELQPGENTPSEDVRKQCHFASALSSSLPRTTACGAPDSLGCADQGESDGRTHCQQRKHEGLKNDEERGPSKERAEASWELRSGRANGRRNGAPKCPRAVKACEETALRTIRHCFDCKC